jgi:acyl-CoA dehydrogenase
MADDRGLNRPGDPIRTRLASLAASIDALEATEHSIVSKLSRGENPGAASSMLKLQGTELLQLVDEASLEVAGAYAAPDQARALHALDLQSGVGPTDAMTATALYLNDRAATIYAGSSEVQRNIISGLILKG